jgi:hypothetical protein
MPPRWLCPILLTAVSSLGFLPVATRGGEAGEFCYVAAIESRPWNGPAGGASAAVNGAGLDGNRHGARLGDTWIQAGAGGNDEAWFVLDLQGRCDLQKLVLWNYFEFGGNEEQNASLPDRGVASADIYVATAESGARIPRNAQGVFNFKAAGWKLIRPQQTFHKAPVARGPDHTIEPTDVVDLTGNPGVTHVALARMKHFARDAFGDYIGLDEIRIVPVPGTYVEDPDRPHAELRAAAALAASGRRSRGEIPGASEGAGGGRRGAVDSGRLRQPVRRNGDRESGQGPGRVARGCGGNAGRPGGEAVRQGGLRER